MMELQYLIVEEDIRPGVTLIRLNRPKVLNALCTPLMEELATTLERLEKEERTKVVVLTGNEKAFAAGADIKEMMDATAVSMAKKEMFEVWDRIKRVKLPIIAAVSGYALGGGCELAMLCDMIVASETAQFGQPEIKIGVIPGAGGTQRLTRAIGKARAMEFILTGKFFSAQQAYEWGLVNKVVPKELYLEEALKLAQEIAAMPAFAVRMAKDAILKAHELSLQEGLYYERKNFYLLFASHDQKEGMKAFVEKRKPQWKDE